MYKKLTAAIAALAGLVGAAGAQGLDQTSRIIVKYRGEAPRVMSVSPAQAEREQRLSASARVQLKGIRALGKGGQVYKLSAPVSLEEANAIARRIAADPAVEYAVPDVRVKAMAAAPNDPYFSYQWSMQASAAAKGHANVLSAWDYSQGHDVTVAVLDSGRVSHIDLAGKEFAGYDFVDADAPSDFSTAGDGNGRDPDASDPGDYCDWEGTTSSWHGLRVSGIIAATANNGLGVAGVAPQAKLLPVRVLGRCGGYMTDIVEGALWAAGMPVPGIPNNPNPARILNFSLGTAPNVKCGAYEREAFETLRDAGVIVVAAAGNDGVEGIASPASCPGVIAVGAHTKQGDLANYSNYSSSVTLTAPAGGNCRKLSGCETDPVVSLMDSGLYGPVGDNGVEYFHGTSAATPHVTGAVALMLALHPELTPDAVRTALVTSARPHPAGTFCASAEGKGKCGAGMLDVAAAIGALDAPTIKVTAPKGPVAGKESVSVTVKVTDNVYGNVTYAWTQVSGPTVKLTDANKATVKFKAPATRSTVVLQVTVRTGLAEVRDTVSVQVNNKPEIALPSTDKVTAGANYSRRLTTKDADGDDVTVTLIEGPQGMALQGKTIVWPSAGPAGTYTVRLQATDEAGLDGEIQSYVLTVDEPSSNGPLPDDTEWYYHEDDRDSSGGGSGGSMPLSSLLMLAGALAASRRKRLS